MTSKKVPTLKPLHLRQSQVELLNKHIDKLITLVNLSQSIDNQNRVEILDVLLNMAHCYSTTVSDRNKYEDLYFQFTETSLPSLEGPQEINRLAWFWTKQGYLCFNYKDYTKMPFTCLQYLKTKGFNWNKYNEPKCWQLKLDVNSNIDNLIKELKPYVIEKQVNNI